uniref:(+)-lariciresinol reductase n=1 Tax=Fagus sylvatica TaxID=28930 RepID=A0A2N9HL51_FAGSY
MEKSKVLVIGGTGYLGKRLVKESLAEGHETYILHRPEIGVDIDKVQMLLSFKEEGAHLVSGSFSDQQSLVNAVKLVDVVICAISGVHIRSHQILLQLKLVDAIKEAGNVKAYMIKNGFDSNRVLASALIDLYSKCGCTEEAYKGFESMDGGDTVSWTTMISSLVQGQKWSQALQLYIRMIEARVHSNEFTFVKLLAASGSLGLSYGKLVHDQRNTFNLDQKPPKIETLDQQPLKPALTHGEYPDHTGADPLIQSPALKLRSP